MVTIGPDGSILNRHRKLVPTSRERMVWGQGDASGLRVVETPVGRIGTLICWESLRAPCAVRAVRTGARHLHRLDLGRKGYLGRDDASVIVAPGGDIVAGPLHQANGILYADIDPGRAPASRRTLDVTGHYGRPDIFHVTVDRSPRSPVSFG